jgi:V-type H+-transporting ATPase subunit D
MNGKKFGICAYMLLMLSFGSLSGAYAMNNDNRFNVAPNRMNLKHYKAKLLGAQDGAKILKGKAEKLEKRYREILKECKAKKHELGEDTKLSAQAMSRTRFACGEIGPLVAATVTKPSVVVEVGNQILSGVTTPTFTALIHDQQQEYGRLHQGGQEFKQTRLLYLKMLKNIINIAQLQASYNIFDSEVKRTRRRVNAIEKILIPKNQATIRYIEDEIDEAEREDKYRIKKMKAKKQAEIDEMQAETERWRQENPLNEDSANLHSSSSEESLF